LTASEYPVKIYQGKMTIMEILIGWLAPPTCVGCEAEGSSLCVACSFSEILPFGERCFGCNKLSPRSKTCPACRAKNTPNYVWVATDHEALPKKLIQKYKFTHQRASAKEITEIMAETFLNQNSDKHLASKNYLLVPVPTASSRIRQRSFDHTQLLAAKLSSLLQIDFKIALGRLGQNQQVGANRSIRISQVANSYFVRPRSSVKGRNILLVDDVVTTGATLSAAAKTLRRSGARSVDALVFSKRL